MNTRAYLASVAFLVLGVLPAVGQSISPPTSKGYPFRVGIVMDGGTFYIFVRPTKDKPASSYCIDGEIQSKTRGEFFEGALHPTADGAKRLPPENAETILRGLEAKLQDFHGKKEFEDIEKKPIDLRGKGMDEKEAERKLQDPKFTDRIATQLLLTAIQEYRERHKAQMPAVAEPNKKPTTTEEANPRER